jgi:hypothetical protein
MAAAVGLLQVKGLTSAVCPELERATGIEPD